MKILFFLLFPLFLFAQTGQTESEIVLLKGRELSSQEVKDLYGWDIIVNKEEKYNPIIYMSDLLDYQTECYNDSTKVWEHIFVPKHVFDCVYDYGCIYSHHYGWVTYHTKPTFEGFIEWFKKHKK